MTCSALATEEWASLLTATRGRRLAKLAGRGRLSRAATRAERLAMVPPDTKQPPAEAGSPAWAARTARAWFSAATAPGFSKAEMACKPITVTSKSPRLAAVVGAVGTNAR